MTFCLIGPRIVLVTREVDETCLEPCVVYDVHLVQNLVRSLALVEPLGSEALCLDLQAFADVGRLDEPFSLSETRILLSVGHGTQKLVGGHAVHGQLMTGIRPDLGGK